MHECRARTCTAHCSAVAVELEGRPPGTQWRYCYQCHKYHELKEFSSPDGSALGLHNCYGSQQRRLKRRKLKEQQKQWDVAAKRLKEEMEKRTGGADAGQLFAMHQFAFAEAAASAALGPWAVGGATIAARRLGIKAAMNKAMWAVTPLATPSPPSSGSRRRNTARRRRKMLRPASRTWSCRRACCRHWMISSCPRWKSTSRTRRSRKTTKRCPRRMPYPDVHLMDCKGL